MPNTMKALVLVTADKTAVVKDMPVPVPAANEILVKVVAVAINPVDAAWVYSPVVAQPDSRIVGIDFAGEVVEVPESLKDSSDPRLRKGARVAGALQGSRQRDRGTATIV